MKVLLKSNKIRFPKDSNVNDGEYYLIKARYGIEIYNEDQYKQIKSKLIELHNTSTEKTSKSIARLIFSSCVIANVENRYLELPSVFTEFLGGDDEYDLIVTDEYIKITKLSETNDGSKSIINGLLE